MVHDPVTVSLDSNALVRVLREAHMSSRPFGGKVGTEDGVGVIVED